MEFNINPNVIKAINLLENNGFETYLVGGSLRDLIMGYEIADFDLSTSASLEDIFNTFKEYKVKKYSNSVNTVLLRINNTEIEITSFKGNTIVEDLSKRDFTVDAMAYSILRGLYDPFGGEEDCKNHLLKTVGNPKDVFTYDPIRILRGIRFFETRELKPNQELIDEMNKYSFLLKDVSRERFKDELNPILLSETPSFYIRTFKDVFFTIIPELKPCYKFDQRNTKWHHLDVLEHILHVLDATKPDLVLRLSALFHDIGKPESFSLDEFGVGHFYGHFKVSEEIAENVLTRLCYGSKIVNRVKKLVYYHDRRLENQTKQLRKFILEFGVDDIDLLFALKRADIIGQNPALLDRIYDLDEIANTCYNLIKENKIITIKKLKINGTDLINMGFIGSEIGKTLKTILDAVVDSKVENEREDLIRFVEIHKEELKNNN